MNAPHDPEMQAILAMTAETIGKDILSALVTEIKLLPDAWPKMSQAKQDDVTALYASSARENRRRVSVPADGASRRPLV